MTKRLFSTRYPWIVTAILLSLSMSCCKPASTIKAVKLQAKPLKRVTKPAQLAAGTWLQDGGAVTVCFDLRRGKSALELKG